MSAESVAQVEQDLGYTQRDAEVLKGVKLVWQKLQKLRGQAVKDDKYLTQFRETLSRSITQARAHQAPEQDDDVAAKAQAFWGWYDGRVKELGVPAKERDRGLPHQEWCAKWCATEWNAFYLAYDRVVSQPSELHFEQAKQKAEAMLKKYVGIFDS